MTLVLKNSIYFMTSIASPFGLAAQLVILSFPTFIVAVILYIASIMNVLNLNKCYLCVIKIIYFFNLMDDLQQLCSSSPELQSVIPSHRKVLSMNSPDEHLNKLSRLSIVFKVIESLMSSTKNILEINTIKAYHGKYRLIIAALLILPQGIYTDLNSHNIIVFGIFANADHSCTLF